MCTTTETQKWQCTNDNCKWIGTNDEKASVQKDSITKEFVCPLCKNPEFYKVSQEEEFSGRKEYIIDHDPTGGQLTVIIDFDFKLSSGDKVLDLISEMVNFWTGAEDNIDDFEGDVVKAFLKNLTHLSLVLQKQFNYNVKGIVDLFKSQEGYAPMDGSAGIEITRISEMELDYYDDYSFKVKNLD
ncbi:Protein of unknown function [Pustulibacterium marinum]|uniref:Uncharacterized protein n=1 Tax=Pustulibacterium marinum TaxID=1224947 RepID=A0A1I7GJY8_9FLAO|nr:DUF2528 family protein [Pustulibacterium marinum]SFU48739.1 Protein of unknown function [Pustulibacterium marinum]